MFLRRSLSAAVALSLLAMIGCQDSAPRSASLPATPQQAIMIRGNDGTTVAFFLPSDDPNKPRALVGAGSEVCPECEAAAVKYFKTGVLDPKCSRTGAIRSVVTFTPPTTGHQ
jgi:hypothetical protein